MWPSEIDHLEFESEELQLIAKSLQGNHLKEIYLNDVCDGMINAGVLALFDVLKESTAVERYFSITTSLDELMKVLPRGTTYEKIGSRHTAFHLPTNSNPSRA